MKQRKRLLWLLTIPLLIVILVVFMHNKTTTEDPLDKILQEDNYPYNGYYSEENISISEQTLTEKIAQTESVSKYTEEMAIRIQANGNVQIQCKLKNLEELFGSVKELSSFQMWASAFDNQNVAADLTITADDNDNAQLIVNSIKIGEMSLDPNLLSPLLTNSALAKQISTIPYSSITFVDGAVSFSNQLPQFLQQLQ